MEFIGECFGRKVFYINYSPYLSQLLQDVGNWICFAISSSVFDDAQVKSFIRNSLLSNMLEFKAQGSQAEQLHGLCDQVMVELEIDENYPFFDIVTTGSNNETLANAFWECFYATCLPERTNYQGLTVMCVSFDEKNYANELKELLLKFNKNWIPED